MKLNLMITVILTIIFTGCSKNAKPFNNDLLLRRWKVISENGEAFRYKGNISDYFQFQSNNILYKQVNGIRDTAFYMESSSGNTLSIQAMSNGINSTSTDTYEILKLTADSLIILKSSPPLFTLDSLRS